MEICLVGVKLRMIGSARGSPESLAVEVTCTHPAGMQREQLAKALKPLEAVGCEFFGKQLGNDEMTIQVCGPRLHPIRVADPTAAAAFGRKVCQDVREALEAEAARLAAANAL